MQIRLPNSVTFIKRNSQNYRMTIFDRQIKQNSRVQWKDYRKGNQLTGFI